MSSVPRRAVPADVLSKLRLICLELPSARERCAAARFRQPPFFRPVWFPDIAGLTLSRATDWDEIEELIKGSYRLLAPRKLAALVE